MSYFNLPPRTYIENDWYPWYQEEAVRAATWRAGFERPNMRAATQAPSMSISS